MFSRATLVPGTDRFEEYYRSRPRNRELDDKFRREPGLLAAGSAHFHRHGFAAADAAFWTIEMLRPFVEGEGPISSGGIEEPVAVPGTKLGGERADSRQEGSVPGDPEAMSRFLKGWTLKMGAHSVGVTELRDYHLYTHVGRGPDYGKVVELDHTYALALTVEMDKEMVDRAPRSPTAMESALQYLRCGVMAVQLADLIRRLGYRARAHVDGLYRVICPLVARDAGLGEFGRMGLLMTPRLGPRVRIAVVTTDLPLAIDAPSPDPTTIEFCLQCKKCADSCPSRAISFGAQEEDENGVLRWRIDAEACFTLWGRLGTDCARCMAVCPYSHPDNAMHSMVRWGIRNNALFRKGSLWMDDLVYGRRPPPKGVLEWMDVPESKG
jgi:reductive dehalogenase